MMKRLLFVLLTALTKVSADCHPADIINTIGGTTYSIDRITATHVLGTQPYFAVAGLYTNATIGVGFIYMYDYNACKVAQSFEFSNINQGFYDISFHSGIILAVGYHRLGPTMMQEVVVVGNVEDFLSKPSKTSTKFPIVLKSPSDFNIPSNGYVLPQAAFITSTKAVVVVSQIYVGVYTVNAKYEAQMTTGNPRVAACFIQDTIVLASLSATDTHISAFLVQVGKLFEMQFPQDHGGSALSKMVAFGTSASQSIIVQTLCMHSGPTQSLILNFYPAVGSSPIQYTSPSAVKVLFLSTDGVYATVIIINSQKVLRKMTIQLSTGSVSNSQISQPVSFLGHYSSTSSDAMLIAAGWDDLIFGLTTALEVERQIVSLSKPIGYIMGLNKNRKTSLMGNDPAPITFSQVAKTFYLVVNDVAAFPGVVSVLANLITEETYTAVKESTQIAPSKAERSLKANSTEWFKQTQACARFSQETFTSECRFYSFFQTFSKLLDVTNPAVPQTASQCKIDKLSKLETFFSDIRGLTAAERNLRATCYPHYSEIANAVPISSGGPLLKVIVSELGFDWAQTYLRSDGYFRPWSYIYKEQSGIGARDIGYKAKATFSPVKVRNRFAQIRSDQWWSLNLIQGKSPSNYSGLKVSCWSKSCPSFFHSNESNFTIWTDFQNTNARVMNATYLYFVEYTSKVKKSQIYQTITLKVQVPNTSASTAKSQVKITVPFEEWIKTNKDKIPWYSPPPKHKQVHQNKAAVVEDPTEKDDLLYAITSDDNSKDSLKIKAKIASWSLDTIKGAITEARARLEKKAKSILVQTSFNEFGLLKISFSSPLSFPSYLIKEALGEDTDNRDLSDILWKRDDYLINTATSLPTMTYSLTTTNSVASVYGAEEPSELPGYSQTDYSYLLDYAEPNYEDYGEDYTYTGTEYDDSFTNADENSSDDSDSLDYSPEYGLGIGDSGNGDGGNEYAETNDEYEQTYDEEEETQDEPLVDDSEPTDELLTDQDYSFDYYSSLGYYDEQVPDFINEISDPSRCKPTEYFDYDKKRCVKFQVYFGTFSELFKVTIKPAEEQSGAQGTSRRLEIEYTHKLVSITPDEIKIQMEFTNPLDVSPFDQIQIEMNFTAFEKGFPADLQMKRQCVRQAIPGTAIQTVQAVGNAGTAATAATVVGSAILQTVMSGCLAQIWGMINGMQFIIHLPALNVAFPSNAFIVIEKILMVATFDIPYVEMGTIDMVFTLPEEEDEILPEEKMMNIKFGLDKLGYGSPYLSNNLGSVFVIVLITSFLLLLSILLTPCRFERAQNFKAYIDRKLKWNFVIRLVIEAYLELAFSVYFNLKYTGCNFNYIGSWVNYFFACLFAALIVAAPFFILGFYHYHFIAFSEEEFEEKYGSVYEGLKREKRSVIVYMTYFVIRRGTFAITSVFLYEYVVLQIESAMIITLLAACYIAVYQPFEEDLLNRLEVMTECFTLLLLAVVFAFTDMFDDTSFQYLIGFVFVGVMCFCIGCHLYFLARDSISDLIKLIKSKLAGRKQAKSDVVKRSNAFGKKQKGITACIKRLCWLKKEGELAEESEDPGVPKINENTARQMLEEIKEESEEEPEDEEESRPADPADLLEQMTDQENNNHLGPSYKIDKMVKVGSLIDEENGGAQIQIGHKDQDQIKSSLLKLELITSLETRTQFHSAHLSAQNFHKKQTLNFAPLQNINSVPCSRAQSLRSPNSEVDESQSREEKPSIKLESLNDEIDEQMDEPAKEEDLKANKEQLNFLRALDHISGHSSNNIVIVQKEDEFELHF